MTNDKDFSYSKFPSHEIKHFGVVGSPIMAMHELESSRRNWKTATLIFASIALMELISFVVLPYFGV